jgi:hypothetical protein
VRVGETRGEQGAGHTNPPRPPAQEPMRREPVRAEHLDDSAAPVNDGAREGERLQGGGLQGGGSSSMPAAGVPREGAVNSKAVVFREDERARLALRAQQEGQEMGKQNEPERGPLTQARTTTSDFACVYWCVNNAPYVGAICSSSITAGCREASSSQNAPSSAIGRTES